MDQQEQRSHAQESTPAAHFSLSPQVGKPRAGRSFSYLALLLGLLSGLLIGTLGTLFCISSAHDVPMPPSQPVPSEAAIVVQLSPEFLSQIATKEVSQVSIPGGLKNIQVTTAQNAPITIGGDEQISLMGGLVVTNHIIVQLQPVIRACQLQISITHADFSGIAVTPFISSFERQINQWLSNESKNSSLPQGFTYCVTNVRTETNNIFVTYSAMPV
jgi:hypothetical protein